MKKSNGLKSILVVCFVVWFIGGGLPLKISAEEREVSIPIVLHVESATSTLFHADLSVSACAPTASSTPIVSGYCALRQSGLEAVWSSYGEDQFLTGINGIKNDFLNNVSWSWFSNLEYGQTSLLQHVVSPHETLLITMKMPMKVTVSTTSPVVGRSTVVSSLHFGFDSTWNPVWLPAASSTLVFGEETFQADANGQFELVTTTTTRRTLFAREDGYLDSRPIEIVPVMYEVATTTPTTENTTTTTTNVSGMGGGGGFTASQNQFDTLKALQFLQSKQQLDGSFGSSLITDWVAIAYAAANEYVGRDLLISYLKNKPVSGDVTEYERRAMALEAVGLNPSTDTTINYIQKIVDYFDGTQIGDPSLVNDDIFALIPLVKAGYTADDSITQKVTSHILSKQHADGSWEGSVDLTAAAVQALLLTSSSEVTDGVHRARMFLTSTQQSDGGFGQSFSTSWSLQAIAALGESGTLWVKNGHTPQDSLNHLQQQDGGIELVTRDEMSRIWATAYAIPAALNMSWGNVLHTFSRPIIPVPPLNQDVTIATSTPEFLSQSEGSIPVELQREYNAPVVIDIRPETQESVEESATLSLESVGTSTTVPQTAVAATLVAVRETQGTSSSRRMVIVLTSVGLIGFCGVIIKKLA